MAFAQQIALGRIALLNTVRLQNILVGICLLFGLDSACMAQAQQAKADIIFDLSGNQLNISDEINVASNGAYSTLLKVTKIGTSGRTTTSQGNLIEGTKGKSYHSNHVSLKLNKGDRVEATLILYSDGEPLISSSRNFNF